MVWFELSTRVEQSTSMLVRRSWLGGVSVRDTRPEPGGAEYITVCTPAFSLEKVNRDAE